MFDSHSIGEIAAVGLAIMLTNSFLTPFFAANEMMSLLQYFLQAWIVLKIDDFLK